MNDDHDLDRRLGDAFTSRAAGMRVSPPDLDELIDRGQQKTRRMLVGGTLGILVIGAAGISVLAGADEAAPSDALLDSLPPAEQTASTTVVLPQATWSCVGPLGTSAGGDVAFYESCTPDGSWSPYAPTTTTIEATVTTVAVPCTIPGCEFQDGEETTSPYNVQPGDYPMLIAERFCTTIDALVAANRWSGPEDFPFPGVVMLIPATGCSAVPATTTTSIPG